jgi:heavy metal translocating P-type ATPase
VKEGLRRAFRPALLVLTVGALLAGVAAWLLGAHHVADTCWITATVIGIGPATWSVIRGLRQGRVGVDVIAVLSLIGTLAVGEYLAGALVAVMLTTGQALEHAAERRATKDLRSLLNRAPRTARRRIRDGVEVVPAEAVVVGDQLVVGSGEVLPVDGRLISDAAVLDESALTGESALVERRSGDNLRSGVVNAGGVLEMSASATADDSTYAGIVRLAQEAAATNASVVRLADRVAGWFLPLALAVAGVAWLVSGTAERAVAVLVVATPCPLLLAVPVAILSGLSRASRLGVVIRNGGALENLGNARTLVMDKTGTLTTGRPRGTDILVAPGRDPSEVLRVAASAEQFSPHVFAEAIVGEAKSRGLRLSSPTGVVENAGSGVIATVDGQSVSVGNLSLPPDAPPWASTALTRATFDGAAVAWVSVDGELAGALLLKDPIRPDAPHTLQRLHSAGLTRMVMLTGDRVAPAEEVGAVLGLDAVFAQQNPADKIEHVRAERLNAVTVMVGDGVNDAPALAAATVGVAMGARGSTASSEAADIVLTTDRLDRLADAMAIARRSRHIALQSATVGMGLSVIAMVFAAFGLLPPALGALLQEAIDVAVILNSLRALRGGDVGSPDLTDRTEKLIRRFAAEHDRMHDQLSVLRDTAEALTGGNPTEALAMLRRADSFLQRTLLPHEHAEDHDLYPALAAPLGSAQATATMSRMHAEIQRLARRLHSHLDVADAAGKLRSDQCDDLLACLYGLYELLRLHFAQEEENYFVLVPAAVNGGLET